MVKTPDRGIFLIKHSELSIEFRTPSLAPVSHTFSRNCTIISQTSYMNTLLDAGVFAKCSIQKGAFFNYEGEWRKKNDMDQLENVLQKLDVEESYYVAVAWSPASGGVTAEANCRICPQR